MSDESGVRCVASVIGGDGWGVLSICLDPGSGHSITG